MLVEYSSESEAEGTVAEDSLEEDEPGKAHGEEAESEDPDSDDEEAPEKRRKFLSASDAFDTITSDNGRNAVFNKKYIEESKIRSLQRAAREPLPPPKADHMTEMQKTQLDPLAKLGGAGRAMDRILRLDALYDDSAKGSKKTEHEAGPSAEQKQHALKALGLAPGSEQPAKEKGKGKNTKDPAESLGDQKKKKRKKDDETERA
eukprot:TRINITY_DN51171_c0_g1_i1.p1 TRINITY_DN51171_c0_g1~~TRINITY_DN51171_c0_g1_i1.p1  ORF type:complete len:228 (-),score=61.18 TRINITY_DN51171_c0_g1_i1:3-614(-)